MLIVSLLRLLLGIVLLVLLLILLLLLLRMLLLLLGALRLLLRCGRRYKCEHILVAVLLFLVVVHNMHIIGNLDPASKLRCLPLIISLTLTVPIALNVVLSMTGRRWTARVEVNHLSLLRVHVLAVCCVLLPTVVLVLLVILVVIVGLGLGKGSLVGRAGAGA